MTNDQMIKQLKMQLGYPAVDLEMTDEQFSSCIECALLMAKDHIYVRRYKSYGLSRPDNRVVMPAFTYSVDLSELQFDIITNVYPTTMVSPYLYDSMYLLNYATSGVPASLALAINMRSNVEALVNRSWKVIDKTLYVDKFYGGVTVEFVPTVIGLEDVDDAYWIGWISRYALALSKEILGRIRGKMVIESNPFRTDAESLISEGTSEKAALIEEISNRGFLDITR